MRSFEFKIFEFKFYSFTVYLTIRRLKSFIFRLLSQNFKNFYNRFEESFKEVQSYSLTRCYAGFTKVIYNKYIFL